VYEFDGQTVNNMACDAARDELRPTEPLECGFVTDCYILFILLTSAKRRLLKPPVAM